MKLFLTGVIGLIGPGLLIFTMGATGAARAADSFTAARDNVQTALREISSPMFTERVKGLQHLNSAVDPQLFATFKVAEKIRALAEKTDEPVPVRIEALRTLVNLNQNGVAVPKLLEFITNLIKSDNSVRVVNAALELIDDTAPTNDGKVVDQERDRAFLALQDIFKDRKRWPISTQSALMTAIGNFPEKKGTIDVLQRAAFTDAEDIEVRRAALRAMRTALMLQNSGDPAMAKNLQDQLVKSGDPEMKLLVLDILETVCANMSPNDLNKFRPSAASRKEIVAMMQSGDDEQVVPAVKFLMRMSAQDSAIVDDLLKAAVPAGDKTPSMSALGQINSALVNALHNLGADRKNAAAAKKIIDHLLDLLAPKNAAAIPADIRETAVLGLGIIPPIFDRREPVACLIALLEIEAGRNYREAQIRLIEEALSSLTGQAPFTLVEYENTGDGKNARKTSPDIAAWNRWFAKNKDKLAGS